MSEALRPGVGGPEPLKKFAASCAGLTLEEGLVHRDVLDADDPLLRLDLEHPVHAELGRTFWEVFGAGVICDFAVASDFRALLDS